MRDADFSDKKRNVLITGVSGYIGGRLAAGLTRLPEIARIAGTDIRSPSATSTKLKFYRRKITEELDDILTENQIDTVIHLAFILRPTHRKKMAGKVDINGTLTLLESCRRAHVKYLLYLSSHTVYGAFPDNPPHIKEDHPVRPLSGFQYSEDKIEVEELLQEYRRIHPETKLTILRVCPVIGPHARGTISTVMMQMPLMIRLRGYDPPMQFVQEDDLVELMLKLISKPVEGTYNVANDGEIRYNEIAKLAGKRMIVLPERLVRPLLSFSWSLRLQTKSPPVGLGFIKYPPLVSTRSLKKNIQYSFRYSTREAIISYLKK